MKKIAVKKNVLVLVASLAGIAPVYGQKQTPPEGGAPKSFTVPASESYVLPNGLKVTLVPYGIIPKAAISLAVDAGSLNEGKSHAGVASLTGDLFREGTVMLTSQQLAQATAQMGSALTVPVGEDQTKFELDVLPGVRA
ncbi:MAG TPA: insulinase family protein [Candidatus Acidoferrum sp.]|nr:insulinase family protein [Candidatus Acidoferrum sp.]